MQHDSLASPHGEKRTINISGVNYINLFHQYNNQLAFVAMARKNTLPGIYGTYGFLYMPSIKIIKATRGKKGFAQCYHSQ